MADQTVDQFEQQPQLEKAAYRLPVDAVVAGLGSDIESGLSAAEAEQRRRRYGGNLLRENGRRPFRRLVLHQFRDPLIIILCVAAALAYYLGDLRGATVLLAIIAINAVIGVYQEFHAEQLLERLRMMVRSRARVIRDGDITEIPADELVPGDMVVLQEGDAVPADLRLVLSSEIATNDFVLTGESLPQDKDAALVVEREAGLPDQDNCVFMGTSVARGSATGLVIATGMASAIGEIAELGQTIERDESPLQREMQALAILLTRMAGVIALGIFAANMFLRSDDFTTTSALINSSILFAIGVAAACVPQGLPAQITVALSLGVGRLARNNAVVKRLSAVETLGCTTVICSDKTGTITSNQMTIVGAWADGHSYEITGRGYDAVGHILENGTPLGEQALEQVRPFFQHGLLASHGRAHEPDETHGDWYALGDPTEAAFMPLAIKAGLDVDALVDATPVVDQLPFDSKRKRMTLLRNRKGNLIGYMKGAASSVLEVCTRVRANGEATALSDSVRQTIVDKVEAYSEQSLRVIALAYREFPDAPEDFSIEESEQDFVFLGLVAMLDPPREGVRDATREVHSARVKLFMLTGDDPITAHAIAERIGMPEGLILTGDDVREMDDEALNKALGNESVIFSRVSPQEKYRVVERLKKMGEVVAVTGDGANDTLSLKRADIGVAMGKQGSEVAKEASEIVLTDDDFTTLVVAIREGRTIYQNLKSVILASMTSNIGELSCVCLGFVGAAMGLPIPITAVQILSIDLIGEMLPLMALTFDPAEKRLMQRPPRRMGSHIINGHRLIELIVFGTLMGLGGYLSLFMVLQTGGSESMAQAATFLGILLIQYVNILSRRTLGSVFSGYLFSNPQLWLSLGLSFAVVSLITGNPDVASWFGFEALRLQDWLWPVLSALVFLGCFELKKKLIAKEVSAK
jgi:Ca2+-transporting ATPase